MPFHFIFLGERLAARLFPLNVMVRGYADVRGAAAFIFGAAAADFIPCASVPGAGILLRAELLPAAFNMPLHLGRVRMYGGGFTALFHAETSAA